MSWQGKYITSIHHRPIPQSQPHPNVSPFPFDPTNTNPPYPHHTAYVDQSLVGTGKVARAAILGQKGGVWAASPGYTLSKPEQDFLVKTAFKEPGAAQAHGITLGGVKFMCLQASDEELLGRKGEKGCIIMKTVQAILVTEYDAGTNAADSNIVVGKLADYLKSTGY